MKFYSRDRLDQFLFVNFFRGKRDGVFVDAGASVEGETDSNSLSFEHFMGWSGLCIVPRSEVFAKFAAQRKCRCEQAPAADLASLLDKHSLTKVDYCSVDAPGGEIELLSKLDLKRTPVSVFSVRSRDPDGNITRWMRDRGYAYFASFERDLVYTSPDCVRLPRTSVFCAVWHGDADRHRLLEGHAENLAKQTVPVEPIYVFDGRDEPPASLRGRKVVVHEDMSIYQAWNVALSMVSTPFVMNLNLDDRLAIDAVENLERALMTHDAALVGGDWKICYSQGDTDAVQKCYPASELPFVNQWPLQPGTHTRLGSGAGERGTLGPATLWRMDAHVGLPRYPWRFPDGTLIKVIGDMCWWTLLMQQSKKKIVRLADIIGHYHSHPGEQAEFRGPSNET